MADSLLQKARNLVGGININLPNLPALPTLPNLPNLPNISLNLPNISLNLSNLPLRLGQGSPPTSTTAAGGPGSTAPAPAPGRRAPTAIELSTSANRRLGVGADLDTDVGLGVGLDPAVGPLGVGPGGASGRRSFESMEAYAARTRGQPAGPTALHHAHLHPNHQGPSQHLAARHAYGHHALAAAVGPAFRGPARAPHPGGHPPAPGSGVPGLAEPGSAPGDHLPSRDEGTEEESGYDSFEEALSACESRMLSAASYMSVGLGMVSGGSVGGGSSAAPSLARGGRSMSMGAGLNVGPLGGGSALGWQEGPIGGAGDSPRAVGSTGGRSRHPLAHPLADSPEEDPMEVDGVGEGQGQVTQAAGTPAKRPAPGPSPLGVAACALRPGDLPPASAPRPSRPGGSGGGRSAAAGAVAAAAAVSDAHGQLAPPSRAAGATAEGEMPPLGPSPFYDQRFVRRVSDPSGDREPLLGAERGEGEGERRAAGREGADAGAGLCGGGVAPDVGQPSLSAWEALRRRLLDSWFGKGILDDEDGEGSGEGEAEEGPTESSGGGSGDEGPARRAGGQPGPAGEGVRPWGGEGSGRPPLPESKRRRRHHPTDDEEARGAAGHQLSMQHQQPEGLAGPPLPASVPGSAQLAVNRWLAAEGGAGAAAGAASWGSRTSVWPGLEVRGGAGYVSAAGERGRLQGAGWPCFEELQVCLELISEFGILVTRGLRGMAS